MSTMLAEQPLVVSILLAALSAVMIFGWLQTGKRPVAIVGLLFLALIPGTWVIAGNWKTPREEIRELIYEVAENVQQNDHNAVLAVIGDPAARAQAAGELPNYVFSKAKVGQIKRIDMIEGAVPPQADVELIVKVTVRQKRGSLQGSVPRRLFLELEKQGDRWLVTKYHHRPLVGQADGYSTGLPGR